MKIDRNDIRLVNACESDKDSPREIMKCLSLKDGELVGADGFLLVKRQAVLDDGEKDIKALLPASMIKQIKPKADQQANLTIESGQATVDYQSMTEYEPKFIFKLVEGDYPAYDKIFESAKKEKKGVIALSVTLLKKLLKTMPDNGILRLGITEVLDPVEFNCDVDYRPITGLIMPMDVDWSDFKWQSEQNPPPEDK